MTHELTVQRKKWKNDNKHSAFVTFKTKISIFIFLSPQIKYIDVL